ncbi:MAG: hypothetical protein Q7S52_00780 [bacterium]|nr:hypothetical protein [bacterium]
MLASSLGQLGIHIPVTPLLVLAFTALLLAAWGIFTLVLRYHWKHYSTRKAEMFMMSFFYFIGSFVLIGLMAFSALLYLSSAT